MERDTPGFLTPQGFRLHCFSQLGPEEWQAVEREQEQPLEHSTVHSSISLALVFPSGWKGRRIGTGRQGRAMWESTFCKQEDLSSGSSPIKSWGHGTGSTQ